MAPYSGYYGSGVTASTSESVGIVYNNTDCSSTASSDPFERVYPDPCELEEFDEPMPRPWAGRREPCQPKRLIVRRARISRRRRRAETARRQKAVKPP